jgi:hypothetical protein
MSPVQEEAGGTPLQPRALEEGLHEVTTLLADTPALAPWRPCTCSNRARGEVSAKQLKNTIMYMYCSLVCNQVAAFTYVWLPVCRGDPPGSCPLAAAPWGLPQQLPPPQLLQQLQAAPWPPPQQPTASPCARHAAAARRLAAPPSRPLWHCTPGWQGPVTPRRHSWPALTHQ